MGGICWCEVHACSDADMYAVPRLSGNPAGVQ
jgi:hypothetical protein